MGQIVNFPVKKKKHDIVLKSGEPGSFRVDYIMLAACYHGCYLGNMDAYEQLLALTNQYLEDKAFVKVPLHLEPYLEEVSYSSVLDCMVELEKISDMESFTK